LPTAVLLAATCFLSSGCIERHDRFPGAHDGAAADRFAGDVAQELEVGPGDAPADPGLADILEAKEELAADIVEVADADALEAEIAPWCGDGICGEAENCEGCPDDCGCEDGEMCAEGKCVCQPHCVGKECGPDGCGGLCDVGECDDGNPCTEDDCADSQCVNELLPLEEMEVVAWKCICEINASCTELNDDDLCNGQLHCAEVEGEPGVKVCQVDPDSVPSCDNGKFCDGPEGCDPFSGDCIPGVPPSVDDFIDCTVDSCDPLLDEPVHLPDHTFCDDLEFCSGEELCDVAAGCLEGTPPETDDLVDCTDDSCDDELDAVVNTPVDALCDDTEFCNGLELCAEIAGCQEGEPPELDDQVDCTEDSCDEAADQVLHLPNHDFCDDTEFCNGAETCDPAAGCLPGLSPDLDDGVDCTVDTCDEELDTVAHTTDHSLCNDEDDCTFDICVADLDCIFPDVPDGSQCDDDSPLAYCLSGTCDCEPDCEDRQCGSDGCGGSCGDCILAGGTELLCNDFYGVCHRPGWVAIPGGSFMMGSPHDELCRETDEGPQHPVAITRALLVSDHEVTQQEWTTLTGAPNPSHFGPDGPEPFCSETDCPVERVNWWEWLHYCNLLSASEGLDECYLLQNCEGTLGGGCEQGGGCYGDYVCSKAIFMGLECNGYRLPTEAEWEYLARAGTDTAYAYPIPGGGVKNDTCGECGLEEDLEDYGWYCDNSLGFTRPVREKGANAWELYDMAGNVQEWCWDEYQPVFYLDSPEVDPIRDGPQIGRSVRGGVFNDEAEHHRSASRHISEWTARWHYNGARPVRSLPAPVCLAACEGKQCGPDGCGGSCGGCLEGTCDDEYGVCKKDGWVVVPSGSFVMGSPHDESCRDDDEGPLHPVTVSHAMLVSDHEVTRAEWIETTGSGNPSQWADCEEPDCPVQMVNWYEAVAYCNDLSALHGLEECYELTDCQGGMAGGCPEGVVMCSGDFSCDVTFKGVACEGYRLPTEAEWEYAARAGSLEALAFPPPEGSPLVSTCECPDCVFEPDPALEGYAWYAGTAGSKLHPVGEVLPNEWGLFDTAGNLSEWVWDQYQADYYASSSVVDPLGGSGSHGVFRGGSFPVWGERCRSAARVNENRLSRRSTTGFRVVRSLATQDCVPACGNRQCGPDGCGGSCGDCGDGQECVEDFGACRPADWLVIPGGTFTMGTPDDEPCRNAEGEGPQHQVTITRPMLVSDHLVTHSEWEETTSLPDPSYSGVTSKGTCASSDCPVETVNWFDAMAYCNALSKKRGLETCYELEQCTGEMGSGCEPLVAGCWDSSTYQCESVTFKGVGCAGYRLPTEAEWEYLARGGTTASLPFPPPFGGGKSSECEPDENMPPYPAPEPNLADYAWYLYNSGDVMHPTRTKFANNFGLYDMLGSVMVWISDPWKAGPYSPEPAVDPVPETDSTPSYAWLRGCGAGHEPGLCRPGSRHYQYAHHRGANYGFRVLRTLLCRDGDTRMCGVDEGDCSSGIQTCVNGVWGECNGAVEPDADLCAGHECGGDNGCGGDCGDCPEGWYCDETYHVCSRPDWVVVEGGTYLMGAGVDEDCSEPDEFPQHEVTITRTLLVSDHEVTNAEWEVVSGQPAPSFFGPNANGPVAKPFCLTGDCPVETVSWNEFLVYCNWLSRMEGLEECYVLDGCSGTLGGGCVPATSSCTGDYQCVDDQAFVGLDCTGYRLPTEAEWEYLARAGTTAAFAYPAPDGADTDVLVGSCVANDCVEEPAVDPYAWHCGHDGPYPKPVRQLAPNNWGLYDMAGNVQESCWDAYSADTYTDEPEEDPIVDGWDKVRVVRGGTADTSAPICRSAERAHDWGWARRSKTVGARIVRTLIAPP